MGGEMSLHRLQTPTPVSLCTEALQMEAMASRLEAMASRLEAIGCGCERVVSTLVSPPCLLPGCVRLGSPPAALKTRPRGPGRGRNDDAFWGMTGFFGTWGGGMWSKKAE